MSLMPMLAASQLSHGFSHEPISECRGRRRPTATRCCREVFSAAERLTLPPSPAISAEPITLDVIASHFLRSPRHHTLITFAAFDFTAFSFFCITAEIISSISFIDALRYFPHLFS
jgi:hypothetical protein